MDKFIYGTCETPLPDIYSVYTPELQKTYPYAVIWIAFVTNTIYLDILKEIDFSSAGILHTTKEDSLFALCSGDSWSEFKASTSNGQIVGSQIKWTNTDLLNYDGSVYLAASDPIPVGTAPALDPLSLFMGWKAGNWVARQRGKA